MKSADKSAALQTLREFLNAFGSPKASGTGTLERRSFMLSEMTF
jgi:hypothetical protein